MRIRTRDHKNSRFDSVKILWNSVLSTYGAKYATLDIANFYLGTPLDRYEYMKMPSDIFPQHTKDQYNLDDMEYKGYVWLEIRKVIYGLPQAGILANKQLRKKLQPHGYYEVAHTPRLSKHVTRPVQFSLLVDDFRVKYIGKKHSQHLTNAIEAEGYKLSINWEGAKCCGITLDWNYEL